MKLNFTAAVAAAALFAGSLTASAEELRLSHQWSTSDVRHKVAQMVADEVAAADVDLDIQIFPSQSLFKAREQYKPLARGQVDMIVFPLSYAGGLRNAYNLTLMPGLVKNHDHAARLNESEFMGDIEGIMAEDDIMVLVHGYRRWLCRQGKVHHRAGGRGRPADPCRWQGVRADAGGGRCLHRVDELGRDL